MTATMTTTMTVSMTVNAAAKCEPMAMTMTRTAVPRAVCAGYASIIGIELAIGVATATAAVQ